LLRGGSNASWPYLRPPLYNYFRDYDPATARYQESDPVGLGSGINTFTYVLADPVAFIDPFGLWKVAGRHVPKPDAVNPSGRAAWGG